MLETTSLTDILTIPGLRHASEFLGPPHNPEWYPAERPRSHYVVAPYQRILPFEIGESIRDTDKFLVDWKGTKVELNRVLKHWGEEPVEDRIPIAAYGANRGPARLIAKMRNWERSIIIPTIRGVVKNGVVLFDSYIWRNGHFASQINPASSLSSRKHERVPITECWINLLSTEQIRALHEAQRIDVPDNGYYFARTPWTYNDETVDVYAYCSYLPCFTIEGKFVRFASEKYEGVDRQGNILLPDKDFAPIETRNGSILDQTVEKCQIEVMEYAADLVLSEFGVELYEAIDDHHAYRVTREAAEVKHDINEYLKKVGRVVPTKYSESKDVYSLADFGKILSA